MFWNISLETANEFYAWGWRASMFGALVTFFGVAFLFWGTRVRDHDFEGSMANLHDRAAASEVQSKQLERSNLTLQGEVERERIERLKIEERLKPRGFTAAARASLIDALKVLPKSGKTYVVASRFDPEAVQFGRLITAILKEAGFEISEGGGSGANILGYDAPGAWIWMRDVNNPPPHAEGIQKAFKAIGLYLDGQSHPDRFADQSELLIAVSSKP